MTQVPAQKTPLAVVDAVAALRRGMGAVIGADPAAEALATLGALSALETGWWRAMWCFNFGNIRAGRRWPGAWCSFTAGEIIDGREVILQPGSGNRFRAYPTADAGAADLCRFLGVDEDGDGQNRYGAAWSACLAGAHEAFALELHRAGYYTASVRKYTAGVLRLHRQLLPQARAILEPPTPAPAPDDPVLVS